MEGVLYTTRERERREEKGAMRKMKKRQNRGLAWRHTKKKKKKRNNQKGLSFSFSHIFTITGTLTKSSFNKNLDNSELKCVNQVLKSIPFSTSTESCKVKSSFWKFCLFNEFLVQLNSLSLSAWESWLCWPSCLKWLDAINVNDFFGCFVLILAQVFTWLEHWPTVEGHNHHHHQRWIVLHCPASSEEDSQVTVEYLRQCSCRPSARRIRPLL